MKVFLTTTFWIEFSSRAFTHTLCWCIVFFDYRTTSVMVKVVFSVNIHQNHSNVSNYNKWFENIFVHVMEKQEEINLIFKLSVESVFMIFRVKNFKTVATVYRPHWLRLVNSSKYVIFNTNHCSFFFFLYRQWFENMAVPPKISNRQNQTDDVEEYSLSN